MFIHGGEEISSEEGTTQGDPLAVPTYALGITPLLSLIQEDKDVNSIQRNKQVAFADDLASVGKLQKLRSWWDKISEKGPLIGYHLKASKSRIVVKDYQYNLTVSLLKVQE